MRYSLGIFSIVLISFFIQLPDNVQIQQEAKDAIAKAAKVFVLYTTAWYDFVNLMRS